MSYMVAWSMPTPGQCGNRSFASAAEALAFAEENVAAWKSYSFWVYPAGRAVAEATRVCRSDLEWLSK